MKMARYCEDALRESNPLETSPWVAADISSVRKSAAILDTMRSTCPIVIELMLGYVADMTAPLFLHITDPHITGEGVPLERDDFKIKIPKIEHGSREAALDLLLSRLAEQLQSEQRELDGVIFSGDAAERGKLSGHAALRDIILNRLGNVGVSPANIVATPGNHDVPRTTAPSSAERYEAFIGAWRNAGCKTPWLDGIDDITRLDPDQHRLLGADNSWVIYPINSANWSHATSELEPPLSEIWEKIPKLLGDGHPDAAKLANQLQSLIRYDMARVSDEQLEAFRTIVSSTPPATLGSQLRLAAIHHHLRAPSLHEEVKPFADFTNLELLRQTLRERMIDVVLHGHKHQHAVQPELIYDTDGLNPRRVMIISGASFDGRKEADAVRLIGLGKLPWTPEIELTRVALPRAGTELKSKLESPISLWRPLEPSSGSITIQGSDLDDVYHRAVELASGEAKGTTLVVDLDLPAASHAGIPVNYPAPQSLDAPGRVQWFDELAGWWQERHSRLEERVPYHHGSRLHRYAGVFDQVDRVRKLIERKASSRAIAILIDPLRDFMPDADDAENFASFCLVQFRKRDIGEDKSAIDVVGYYRAQEFLRWWPINISELRALQLAVCDGKKRVPGRISTITSEARAIGRSPTEVSVPVIDRWLDQHPGRLFLLATYLTCGKVENEATRDDVVSGWTQSLEDFEFAAEHFNEDGVPLAIDGLATLMCYIEALKPSGQLREFVDALDALRKANIAYLGTKQRSKDFDNWGALPHIRQLRKLSAALLDEQVSAI